MKVIMTIEISDEVAEALTTIVTYVLMTAERKMYNQAEILLKWLQDNGVMLK